MNIDYQVLRFENKIKPKDIGGLGVELDARKGSGNYDKERTQFNKEYIGFDGHSTLKSKIYSTIYNNNIHFNKGEKTNILNGCIVTSGPDFFKKLGLPMKDSGRVYGEKSKHPGEKIYCPDIKTKDDIPSEVYRFFDESFNFLSNYVGKENVVYASIHLDEDTPHMHFYFLPIVNSVQRETFETDENGKRIIKETTTKDGIVKQNPVLKRNEKGDIIYTTEYGKFLNTDEFWKQKGGKTSFAKIQDEYNEFIKSKGFDLDRGHVGAHREHQSKLEYTIKNLQAQVEKLSKDVELYEEINSIQLETNKEIINLNTEEVLSPTKDFFNKYKNEDVEKIKQYAKEINKDNASYKSKIKSKDAKINQLEDEVRKLKNTDLYTKNYKQMTALESKDNEIKELTETIKSKDKEIASLKGIIERIIKKTFYVIQYLVGKTKDKITDLFNWDSKNDFRAFESQLDRMLNKYENKKDITKDKTMNK